MNSQISIREVAVFPVMKTDRHVCLSILRFVYPFPSFLLFTTKDVARGFHCPDGENIVERPQFLYAAVATPFLSLVCFGNEMF